MHQLDGLILQNSIPGYNLNSINDAFRNKPFYLGIYPSNDESSTYDKPFEGYMRNIKFNGELQSIDPVSLNGTLVIRDCPKDLQFSNNVGSVRLFENFNVDDSIQVYFDLKISDSGNCSALLLSAYSGEDDHDSYFIVEIVNNVLYMKMKSPYKVSSVKLTTFFGDDNELCDGNWHKSMLN